jgi:hypothetical protein
MAPNYLSVTEREFIRSLGVLSTFRGLDSTGIASIFGRKKDIKVRHGLTTAPELLWGYETQELFDAKHDTNLMLGHTRAATLGGITIANAHPFVFPNVIGCHNGTIGSLQEKDKEKNPEDLSDSYFLYQKINEFGLLDVIKDLPTYGAAYALTMYFPGTNKLCIIRNSDRSLFYACDNSGTNYWASEWSFLNFVMNRTVTRDKFPKDDPIRLVPADTLLVYDMGKKAWEDPVELKPKPKVYPAWGRGQAEAGEDWSYNGQGWFSSYRESKQEAKAEVKKEAAAPTPRIVGGPPFPGASADATYHYKGYLGKSLTITKAKELLKAGDSYGNRPCDLTDSVVWISDTEFLLFKDMEDEFIKQYVLPSVERPTPGKIVCRPRTKTGSVAGSPIILPALPHKEVATPLKEVAVG